MMIIKTILAAAVTTGLTAGSALAWGDMYMGDGTNNPDSGPVYAYPAAANYCPAGTRPVVLGGVICCGTPTAAGHGDDTPMPQRRVYRKAAPGYAASRAHAPVGEKGVVYR